MKALVWPQRDLNDELAVAVMDNDAEAVQFWLEHGADPNSWRSFPLDCAIQSGNKHIATMLARAGADARGLTQPRLRQLSRLLTP
ncbi:MAG: ankyrin repeat domain-containing protein [Myxococcota bacterium]